jgi:hypothetical protein
MLSTHHAGECGWSKSVRVLGRRERARRRRVDRDSRPSNLIDNRAATPTTDTRLTTVEIRVFPPVGDGRSDYENWENTARERGA